MKEIQLGQRVQRNKIQGDERSLDMVTEPRSGRDVILNRDCLQARRVRRWLGHMESMIEIFFLGTVNIKLSELRETGSQSFAMRYAV